MSGSSGLLCYENLAHAFAGGCGASVAMSVFYPLETVRTRLQLEAGKGENGQEGEESAQEKLKARRSVLAMLRAIYRSEGLPGLYKGLVPVLQSLYCSQFVYFYAFHGLKRALNPDNTALRNLFCGMAAGIVNVLTTCPLWVVNTRIKMAQREAGQGPYGGLLGGLRHVYATEGVSGLWSGCGASLLLVVNPALQFMAYELLRRLVASTGSRSAAAFVSGAAAKAFAATLTYPLQLGQTRQRLDSSRSLPQLLRAAVQQEGPTGLLRGLRAKLLQTVLTAALMFLCYENIVALVLRLLHAR